MNQIFLDTTVQVSRLTGLSTVRASLDGYLSGHVVQTSSIVFMEFQRTVIDAHRLVLPVLEETPDAGNGIVRLSEFYNRLASSPQLRSDRQVKRVLAVVASIQQRFEDDRDVRVDDLRAFIEGEIKLFRESRFFTFGMGDNTLDIRSTGGYLNSLECAVAETPLDPHVEKPQRTTCNAQRRKCNFRSFMNIYREITGPLANELATADPKGANAALRLSKFDPKKFVGKKAVGQKQCWPLGDMLIALECPEDAMLLSSDHSFGVICPFLGKIWLRFNYLTGTVE